MLTRKLLVLCAAALLATGCGKKPASPAASTGATSASSTTASGTHGATSSTGSTSSGTSGASTSSGSTTGTASSSGATTSSGSTSTTSASGSTGASSTSTSASSTTTGSTGASSTSTSSAGSTGTSASASTGAASTSTGSTGAATTGSTGASSSSTTSASSASGSTGAGSTGTSSSSGTSATSSSASSSGTGTSGTSSGATTGTSGSSGTTGAPPANDTCAGAIALTAGVTVNGDTRPAANDFDFKNTNCTGALTLGKDVVYTFTPQVSGVHKVVLTPNGWDAALYVLPTCPSDGHGLTTCTAGADVAGVGGVEQLTLSLTAGTPITLVVDSYSESASNASGPFTLLVQAPAPDDFCSNLTPTLSLNTTLVGDTTGYGNEYYEGITTACTFANGAQGPDAVYAFTPPADGLYNITATPTSTWDVALWVVDGVSCPALGTLPSNCTGGADNGLAGDAEHVVVDLIGGHRYYVGVDGFSASSFGPFALSVTTEQPGDSCSNASTALAVLTGPGTSATISGATTVGFADDRTPSCAPAGATGPDVAYSFTLSQAAALTATISPTSSGYTPILFLENGCNTAFANDGCRVGLAPGQPVSLNVNSLAAGAYTLWVDGNSSSGSYNLQVTLSAVATAQPGDSCSSQLGDLASLQNVGDSTLVSGNTTGLVDDNFGTCTSSAGPDVVYSLTPAQDVTLAATVSPTASGYRPVLYLQDTCAAGGGQDLACNEAGAAGGQASLGGVKLQAGLSYALWVDSNGAGGPYNLSVAFLPPPPPPLGENCAAIDQDGGSSQITLLAEPDGGQRAQLATTVVGYADNSNASATCLEHGHGGDRVYRLVLAAPMPSVTATLTPSSPNYNPVVYLRDSPCIERLDGGASPSDLGCAYNDTPGALASFTSGPLAAGTYYLWVDSYGGTEGPGTLIVSVP